MSPDDGFGYEEITFHLEAVGKGWQWLTDSGIARGPVFRFKADAQAWAEETCAGQYITKDFSGRNHEP